MADIGCGIGYFTIPAAKIVGNKGTVFALDISPQMLEEVKNKAAEENIQNIKTIRVNENDLKLQDETITYAFLSNILHEVENLEMFLKEIKRIVAPGGKIVIIEWEKKVSDYGPPIHHRIDKHDLEVFLKNNEYRNLVHMNLGIDFYVITGEK